MKRLQRATVLLSLLEALKARGSWCGETHIQKSTYFLQEMMETPLGFEFVLYKHGPYSFDLSDEITALRADLLLDVISRAPYGPSLVPSETSASFLKNFPLTRQQFQPAIEFIADRLAHKNVAELEKLGTALFVTKSTPSEVADDRVERLSKLKPHIDAVEARRALQVVDAMLAESREFVPA
jgi:uncharacterized protein YwgA